MIGRADIMAHISKVPSSQETIKKPFEDCKVAKQEGTFSSVLEKKSQEKEVTNPSEEKKVKATVAEHANKTKAKAKVVLEKTEESGQESVTKEVVAEDVVQEPTSCVEEQDEKVFSESEEKVEEFAPKNKELGEEETLLLLMNQISQLEKLITKLEGISDEIPQNDLKELTKLLEAFPELIQNSELKVDTFTKVEKQFEMIISKFSTFESKVEMPLQTVLEEGKVDVDMPQLSSKEANLNNFEEVLELTKNSIKEVQVVVQQIEESVQSLKQQLESTVSNRPILLKESSDVETPASDQLMGNEQVDVTEDTTNSLQSETESFQQQEEAGEDNTSSSEKKVTAKTEEWTPTKMVIGEKVIESSEKAEVVGKEKLETSILKQVQEKAQLDLSNGKQEIKISLNPEHLGEMTLKIQIYKGQLFAKAFVQNETVKGALENQFQELKQIFQSQGYKQVEVSVEAQRQNMHNQDGGFREQKKEQVMYFNKKIAKNRLLTQISDSWQGGYIPSISNYIGEEGMDVMI